MDSWSPLIYSICHLKEYIIHLLLFLLDNPFVLKVQQPKNPFHLLNAFTIVKGFPMQWTEQVYLLNSKLCVSTIGQIGFIIMSHSNNY